MADLGRPKLSNLSWQGDKNEDGSYTFLENFGNMVRSTGNGFHLEDMLDSKLRQAAMSQCSVPSCLLMDPDFAVLVAPQAPHCAPSGAEAEAAVDDESASTSVDVNMTLYSASTGSTFSLGTHSVAYNDLPVAARTLDAMLYNIFKMSIKGSKQALLQCVTFPSYVQAVIVLVEHNIILWTSQECVVLDMHLAGSRISSFMGMPFDSNLTFSL